MAHRFPLAAGNRWSWVLILARRHLRRVHLCPTFNCPYIMPLPSTSLVVSRLRLKNAHVSTSDGPIEYMVEGDLCSSQCCTRVKFHPAKSAPAAIQSNPKRNIRLGSHSGCLHNPNTINSEVVMSGTVAKEQIKSAGPGLWSPGFGMLMTELLLD